MLQPKINTNDFRGANGKSVPNLQRALSHENVATAWSVASVAGEVSADGIADYINKACAKADKTPVVEQMNLPALPSQNSASKLAENGVFLSTRLRAVYNFWMACG